MDHSDPERSIISTIQTDAFICLIKEAKKAQGKTNQEIADATGIPLSNISKFLSGNLANPNIYNAAAVCIYLGISLDKAFGIIQHEVVDRVELEERVRELQIHLEYARQDKNNLEKALQSRKMIIAVLFGMCILMIAAFGFGIIYDSSIQDAGFIQGSSVAPISIVCITTIVIAIAVTIVITGRYLYNKKEKE